MRCRGEGLVQKEKYEQRLRGKKHRSCLGEIHILLIHMKVTFLAGDEIIVPDYGRVWSLSYMFMFLHVRPIDSLQQHLLEYLHKCKSKSTPRWGKLIHKICCFCPELGLSL